MIQSNENEEYEFILGQNAQKEYLVKIIGEPYCRCKWVSKDTILNSPNGEELITRYLHSNNHKTSPPFYNEEYDIPDHIIQRKENLFLVKWTHLYYDQLTWEKKIDKQFISVFRTRKASKFPKAVLISNNILLDSCYFPIKKFALYQDLNTTSDVVEEVQFLFTALQHDDVTITEVDDNHRSIFSTSAFLHYFYRKMNDPGPYLIVVDKREFNDWYDFLNRSKELTILAYNGTDISRTKLREIDFISEDNSTLHFQVLVTTHHILETDIDYLQQIEWKFCFFHYLNETNSNTISNLLKFIQKLKILRKITYQPVDQKTIISRAKAISTVFEAGPLKDLLNTRSCEDFSQFIQKSKISSSNKVESTYFYIVECPMNDIQKHVCQYLLYKNINLQSPEKSNFFIIARLFYYVIQHPFIIPGIESKLCHESVLLASTKMRVMRRIIYETQIEIEESGAFQNILICTQIPEMYNIINDFIDEIYQDEQYIHTYLEFDFRAVNHSNSNINLSSNSSLTNLSTNSQIPFKTIDIIIIFDGKLKHWEKLLDSKITQSSRIYKLESLDSREIEITQSPSSTDQDICKTMTLQIMLPSGKISPRELLEGNLSFDSIKNDQHSSSFAVNTFTGEDFWQKFVNTPEFSTFKTILDTYKTKIEPATNDIIDTNANSSKAYVKKNQKNPKMQNFKNQPQNQNTNTNEAQFSQNPLSLYQKRTFVRSLLSKGWCNFDKIINSVGFEMNEDMCKKLCITVLTLIKYEKEKNKYKKDKKIKNDKKANPECNFVSNIYRDFILQTKTDNTIYPKAFNLNPNNFKEQLRSDKVFLTEELPLDFFERIFQIACLCHFFESNLYNENDINSFDLLQFDSSKPESWWTEEHDKALLYGMWKYGQRNYISFMMKNTENESSNVKLFDGYDRILKEISLSNVCTQILDRRELDLLSFITSYVMDDLRRNHNNFLKTLPNWTEEEQQTVISYILAHGINFNSNKEINEIAAKFVNNGTADITETLVDTENEKKHKKGEEEEEEEAKEKENENEKENQQDAVFQLYQLPNKTKEAVADFLQLIKKEIAHPNPEEGGLSYITAVRLRIRIIAMKFLHNYVLHVKDGKLYFFYTHVPKWKIGNYNISTELEHLFMCEIEKRGFGNIAPILSEPSFSKITDIQVLSHMKDEYRVILRIYNLSQVAIKKDLFAREPTNGEDEFEKMFGITLPLSISSSYIIHSFGKIIPDNPEFHTERYIYPIGFKTSRLSPSITNAGIKARWYSEISKNGNSPLFRVWQDGYADNVFEGPTATTAWVKALKASKRDNNVSISGPDSFLLNHPIVTYFIQKMPGASECKNYIMRNQDDNQIVKQFLKTISTTQSSNEDGSDSQV